MVRLMANMFSAKKSVLEGMQMLPEISLEKIRREIEVVKAQEKARVEKEKRELQQWERHQQAARFIEKFD